MSLPYAPLHRVEEYLDELSSLALTAGAQEAERVIQKRDSVDAACFVGEGKAREIGETCGREKIPLVIFDDELSPAQVRNLEKITGVKVLDRTGLILDIFARRARTRESQAQVALAQYTYLLPRLTRAWGHLSRQAGGIGTRGVGETQLETDRRVIRARIAKLSEEIVKISERRAVQSGRRENAFVAALAGYTNVGKSSLMNALTGSRLFAEDRLFATLETTFRRFRPGDIVQEVLLVDTIGFIRKLPHNLVASFRSTLNEISRADLIVYVMDASHPDFEEQHSVVRESLAEMGCAEIPSVVVLNKADAAGEGQLSRAAGMFPGAIAVSAKTGHNMPLLKRAIAAEVEKAFKGTTLRIPYGRLFEFLKERSGVTVLRETYHDDHVEVKIRGRQETVAALERTMKQD